MAYGFFILIKSIFGKKSVIGSTLKKENEACIQPSGVNEPTAKSLSKQGAEIGLFFGDVIFTTYVAFEIVQSIL
jgi:hypothetical protein